MDKEELIKLINLKCDEMDSLLIKDLNKIFIENNEQSRNEALLRAIHSINFQIDYTIPIEKVISDLAIQVTKYIIKNGCIEEFHSGKFTIEDYENIPPNTPLKEICQLINENMNTLLQELVDKIGFLIKLFVQADYLHLNTAINGYKYCGKPINAPDIEKIESEYYDYVFQLTGMDKLLKK